MARIYKVKDRLMVTLPPEMIKELGLSEGDELEFFKVNSTAFLASKGASKVPEPAQAQPQRQPQGTGRLDRMELSEDEIGVLRKLDTIRYPMRSMESMEKLLTSQDKSVLDKLIKKGVVTIFKGASNQPLYSISKIIYDRFLMRKKPVQARNTPEPIAVKAVEHKVDRPAKPIQFRARPGEIKIKAGFGNPNVEILEEHGFIVLQTETEASSLSLALEESIRQGFVIGTRAFNKRFYIVLRSFFDRYGIESMRAIREGANRVEQISEKVGLDDPEGVRAVMYLLAEAGDVSEKRKDYFVLA